MKRWHTQSPVHLGCHTSPISLHFTIILRFSNNMTLLDMHKYREVPRQTIMQKEVVTPLTKVATIVIPQTPLEPPLNPHLNTSHTAMNPPISSPDLSSMQFKAEFRKSEASSIFEIEHHGNRYALKVVCILISSTFSRSRTNIAVPRQW